MAISLGKVFEPFIEQRPICVMARGVLENLFNADKIDALFARTAEVQYTRALLFSSVVALMGQVVLGVQPSVHAASQAQAAQLGISDQAISDTLRQVELRVSAELVRDAARQASPVIEALQAELPPLAPGYRAKILDGNHLAASAHRLEALRRTWAAPLPGQILVVLDQQRMLATEVVLCEDGHAQERSLLGQVLPCVEPDDLWIADRNFCPGDFLRGIAARGGCLVVRQHGQLKGTLVGRRQSKGALDTGKVYEQKIGLVNAQGAPLLLRRMTVALHEPTRAGDTAIHVLRNVPMRKARAQKLAESDGKRWTIATMFQELTETLPCAVNALGYPGIRVRRDNLASVRYAEGLHSSKSSVTFQRTARHDILGQKSAGFQRSLGERYAECAPDCPQDGLVHKPGPSSHAGHGAAGTSSGVLVVGDGGRPPVVDAPGRRHARHVWSQTRCGDGHAARVFRAPAS
jgi:hypothetical protein